MKSLRSSALLCSVILAAAAAAGDNLSANDFKSPAARMAVDTYSSTLVKLSRDYKEKSDTARRVCITQLTSAQQAATKAANLDEAVRIRDTIAKLSAELPEPPARANGLNADRQRLTQQLVNSTWQTGDTKIHFNEDGTGIYLNSKNPPWQWVAIDGQAVYMQYNTGWTNRLDFDEQVKTFTYHDLGNGTKRDAQNGKRVQP